MWKKIWYSPLMRLFIGFFVIALEMISMHAWVIPSLNKMRPISPVLDQLFITALFCSVIVGSYIFFYRWYEKRKISELSLSCFLQNSSGGLLIGLGYYSFVIGIIYLAGGYLIKGLDPGIYILSAFIATFIVGISEEILFRGIVFRLLEEKLGSWFALFISSFIFGFLHIWNPDATIFSSLAIALEAGFSLGAAYVLTRNLWFPIFFHIAWNFVGHTIYGIPVSGSPSSRSLFISEISGPEWLTGGAFGPENSIQAVVIGVIIGVVFMILAKRKGHIIPFRK